MKLRSELPCATVARWLPAAAAGALDRVEQATVAAHLRHCNACRATLQEFASVVGQLAYAVPQGEPSARLLPRLLAAVLAQGRPPIPPPARGKTCRG